MPKKKTNQWKNKILSYELVDPETLLANPHNHRIHNSLQEENLETLLETVGWVDVVKANKNGSRIVDGHLRHTMAIRLGESEIPVIWLDLTPDEEKLALATLDWISSQADINPKLYETLLGDLEDGEILPDDSELLNLIRDTTLDGFKQASNDDWETAFDKVPEGERSEFQEMTFVLHDTQVKVIKRSIKKALGMGKFKKSKNRNRNGNALTRISEYFLDGDHGKG